MVQLRYQTADDLAKVLLKVDGPRAVLSQQFNGIVPIACGVGICFALTVQCLVNRQTDRSLHKALLLAVAFLTLADFTLMCVNREQIVDHLDSLADLYYFDSMCIIISFLLTSFTAYLSQIFFGLRAYVLWNRRKVVAVPIIVSSHISLFSGVALDIYGLTQPRFDHSTSGEELRAVARWFERLIRVRRGLQLVWVMSTLVCDLIICTLIIIALLRMKTNTVLHSTKSLIGKIVVLIMETMVPPMIMALLFAIIIISRKVGPGSWFRNTAAFQSLFYWFAIVWVIRTNRRFMGKMNLGEEGNESGLEVETEEMAYVSAEEDGSTEMKLLENDDARNDGRRIDRYERRSHELLPSA